MGEENLKVGDSQVIERVSKPVDEALTKWQLTVNDLLIEIENNLKGIRIIKTEEGLRKERFSKPVMSEEAISNVIREISMRVNKISFLSDLTEEQIKKITGTVQRNISAYFFDNPEMIKLEAERWNMVIDSIGDMIFIGLRKALDAGERNALRDMERRLERTGVEQSNKSKNILGFINGE